MIINKFNTVIKAIFFILTVTVIIINFQCGSGDSSSAISSAGLMNVLINEIMPAGGTDWIELYNPNGQRVDISGYYVSDDLNETGYQIPANTFINANSFTVILCTEEITGFKLNAGKGENVILKDPDLYIVNGKSFPAGEDIYKSGKSYGRITDGGNLWDYLNTPTPDASNTGLPLNTAPKFGRVNITPSYPESDSDVTIQAVITDDKTVNNVILYYDTGTGYQNFSMTGTGNNTYEYLIPRHPDSEVITFFITAQDNEDTISRKPENSPDSLSYIISSQTYIPPKIYVNEALPSNKDEGPGDAGWQDPDFNRRGDWFELYNAETYAVDLSGMYLTDDITKPKRWKIPSGITIQADSYIVIWANGRDTTVKAMHTNFKLTADGEIICLFNTEYRNNALIDSLTYPALGTNVSYGRKTGGSIGLVQHPTPGEPNP